MFLRVVCLRPCPRYGAGAGAGAGAYRFNPPGIWYLLGEERGAMAAAVVPLRQSWTPVEHVTTHVRDPPPHPAAPERGQRGGGLISPRPQCGSRGRRERGEPVPARRVESSREAETDNRESPFLFIALTFSCDGTPPRLVSISALGRIARRPQIQREQGLKNVPERDPGRERGPG